MGTIGCAIFCSAVVIRSRSGDRNGEADQQEAERTLHISRCKPDCWGIIHIRDDCESENEDVDRAAPEEDQSQAPKQ